MIFKIGDKVVCKNVNDFYERNFEFFDHPKINEVVTVGFISENKWLHFLEYHPDNGYEYYNFEKLSNSTIDSFMNEVKEEEVMI